MLGPSSATALMIIDLFYANYNEQFSSDADVSIFCRTASS